MHRQKVLHLLNEYKPYDDREQQAHEETRTFVKHNHDCFDNANPKGHITTSAWVIDVDRQMVGLVFHQRRRKWFLPGGHSDGNGESPQEAYREAVEEFGADGLALLSEHIFDIDMHVVTRDVVYGLGRHMHYDLRFVVVGDSSIPPIPCSEGGHVPTWVAIDDVPRYCAGESYVRMVEKSTGIVVVG